MQTIRALVMVFGAVALGPVAAGAQEAPAGPPAGQHAGGPPPVDRWWEESSLEKTPLVEKTRLHLTSDISFSDQRGNTDGTQYSTSTEFIARKKRTTSRSTMDFRRTDMVYGMGGGSADYEQRTIRQTVEYDLSKRMLVIAGVEYARNTLMFIDRRVTGFAGGGMTVVKTPDHQFNFIGGLGYAAYKFQRDEMSEVNAEAVAALPTVTPGSGAVLVQETWRWKLSPRVTLQQSGSLLEYFEQDLGETWTFDIGAEIPVTKWLSVRPRYSLREERNIYVEALGVKTLDRTFGFGLRVNF